MPKPQSTNRLNKNKPDRFNFKIVIISLIEKLIKNNESIAKALMRRVSYKRTIPCEWAMCCKSEMIYGALGRNNSQIKPKMILPYRFCNPFCHNIKKVILYGMMARNRFQTRKSRKKDVVILMRNNNKTEHNRVPKKRMRSSLYFFKRSVFIIKQLIGLQKHIPMLLECSIAL